MGDDMSIGDGVLGTLRASGGAGVVRLEVRVDSSVAEVWSAVTDQERLARWYGQVTGELREGGRLDIYLAGPDLSSTGRVERCERPQALLVRTRETEESARRGGGAAFDQTMDVALVGAGEQTVLVVEVSGLPMSKIAAYGVGWQLQAERLLAYLTGQAGPDVEARWGELAGRYDELAAGLARTRP